MCLTTRPMVIDFFLFDASNTIPTNSPPNKSITLSKFLTYRPSSACGRSAFDGNNKIAQNMILGGWDVFIYFLDHSLHLRSLHLRVPLFRCFKG